MYLKRLEIVGFKSFANAFELEFRTGISCIVGPNGCGKSNVADAIRWALGSQSPTELRADRMEDVIFSGTVDRKPLGMAEVILTFDNSKRELPLDFDEVTVTRRLFRSGESEYLINGNRCRLMDITDLIVDRGLGSNSYWILETSMVKAIIESRPVDRRSLFDEAAGIVKYKIQRHRAELKLNSASGDLERLDDIILEVDRNVSVLKKQVRAYRRWKSAEEKISELDGLLRFRQLDDSRNRMAELETSLRASRGTEQECSAAVSAAAARQAQSRMELEKAQAQLDREHEACAVLDSELGTVSEKFAVSSERRRSAGEQVTSTEQQSVAEQERVQQITVEIDDLAGRMEAYQKNEAEIAKRHEETSAEATRIEEEHSTSAAELEKARTVLRETSEKLRTAQEQYNTSLREAERAGQELETSTNRLLVIEGSIIGIDETLAGKHKAIAGFDADLTHRSEELAGKRASLSDLDSSIENLTTQCAELNTRISILDLRVQQLASAVNSEKAGSGRISDLIEVTDGMGMAVGAWLDAFQDSVVQSTESMSTSIETGRYLLLSSDDEGGCSRPDMPEGAIWLPDCIKKVDSAPSVSTLLSGCIVAPGRTEAMEWFLSGIQLDIVTTAGDLFRRDGLVRLGILEEGAGSIERQALAGLARRELKDLRAELHSREGEKDTLRSRRSDAIMTIEALRESITDLQAELTSESTRASGLESRREEMITELTEIRKSLPELESKIRQDGEGSLSDIEQMRTDSERLSSAVSALEISHGSNAEQLNHAIRDENAAALKKASLEADLKQVIREHARCVSDAAAAGKKSVELFVRSGELTGVCEALDEQLSEFSRQKVEISGRRETAEERRTLASRSRAEWLEKARELDRELSTLREQLSDAKEIRATLTGEAETVKTRVAELEALDLMLPVESSRYWKLPVEELEKELARQRGYRENLGPVNMLAVAEFEEASTRIDFLSGQRTDLMDARTSLLEAIEEINRTAAKKFTETFAEVRRNFQEMFSSLFGGGEADLLALEADDPLEGGVQIVARPPGKKLENVTALSSGERAMTAVALLFALYLVKPSPFCVLDELDAPLDDSNVDHFIDLVKGFIDRTQFIVITHNKRTMEAADRLFGITMIEKGVSAMTSVNLETAMKMTSGDGSDDGS